jgi:hypothetical protein
MNSDYTPGPPQVQRPPPPPAFTLVKPAVQRLIAHGVIADGTEPNIVVPDLVEQDRECSDPHVAQAVS